MSNPFKYGGVVGKTAFCNRKQELADLARAMENGDRLFLYSERRLGKTYLVKLALSELPKKDYLWAYVDLWPTDGEASFAAAIAKPITESLASTADKVLAVAKGFFGGLKPTISADSSGNPQISFQLGGMSASYWNCRKFCKLQRRSPKAGSARWSWSLMNFRGSSNTAPTTRNELFAAEQRVAGEELPIPTDFQSPVAESIDGPLET